MASTKSKERRELIARLTWQPPPGHQSVISVPERPSFTHVSLESTSRTRVAASTLRTLPVEILQMVFLHLDLQSLGRLRQTSSCEAAVVQFLPEYRQVFEHAPEALAGLGAMRLLCHYSLSTLCAAIRSTGCVYCSRPGTLLFLLTCSRVCPQCLGEDPRLWVMPGELAQELFGSLTESIGRLPSVLVDGIAPVGYVSVRAVRELALQRYRRSAARLREDLRHLLSQDDRHDHARRVVFAHIQQSSEAMHVRDFLDALSAWLPTIYDNNVATVGLTPVVSPSTASTTAPAPSAIPFPRPHARSVVFGLWCDGCRIRTLRNERRSCAYMLNMQHFSWIDEELRGFLPTPRSQEEFLAHLSYCPGSYEKIPDLRERLEHLLGCEGGTLPPRPPTQLMGSLSAGLCAEEEYRDLVVRWRSLG